MELNQILSEVNQIFIELFEDPSIKLTASTTSADVEAWDSLNHIQVITAIESYYHIQFEMNELLNFATVGDLCRSVQQKLPRHSMYI